MFLLEQLQIYQENELRRDGRLPCEDAEVSTLMSTWLE